MSNVADEVTDLLAVLWERAQDVSPAPLSAAQLRALYVIERHDGISLRGLTEALGSTPPSVSRLCDRLQTIGFVDRTTSVTSRREIELRLSELGRGYLRELRTRRAQHFRPLIEAMPPHAQQSLREGLGFFLGAAGFAGDRHVV